SITVTNWTLALLTSALTFHWRRAAQVITNGFALLSAAWILGHLIVPSTVFIGPTLFEKNFVYVPSPSRLVGVATSFFAHSMVAAREPEPTPLLRNGWVGLTLQGVLPKFTDALGAVAAWGWIGLLAVGTWGMLRDKGPARVPLTIGLFLLAQFGLHSVYGEETFLYSLHWLPFLVMTAAYGCRSKARYGVLAATCLLTVLVAVVNYQALYAATERALEMNAERVRTVGAR
ncbi:MAG TPA: hypothetical protein VEQ63_03960, partial [Bryobacteraceae bacterium]|nr:hypothetical protein [Bryobacteraceae bacterium]